MLQNAVSQTKYYSIAKIKHLPPHFVPPKIFLGRHEAHARFSLVCKHNTDETCTWASAENFPGGQSRQFPSFSGCWQCNANERSQNALSFYTTKEMHQVTANASKMRFVRSNASFSLTHIKLPATNSHCLAALPPAATDICV